MNGAGVPAPACPCKIVHEPSEREQTVPQEAGRGPSAQAAPGVNGRQIARRSHLPMDGRRRSGPVPKVRASSAAL
ncbi:hypothetical protein MTO96_048747 [Rhipicephalus appendiculatus]